MLAIKRKDGQYYAGLGQWTLRKADRRTYSLKSELPGNIGPAVLIDTKEYRLSAIMVLARVEEV